jgi:DNA-directed RNA polymerase subunit M/transcription elongation factor TFIIS
MICYPCPKCNDSLSYPDSMSGEKTTCPACGNVSFIPFKTAESPRPSDRSKHSSSVEQVQSIRQQQTCAPTCPLCGCRLEKWIHGLAATLLSAVGVIISLYFIFTGFPLGLLLLMSIWLVRRPENAWLCPGCKTKWPRHL